MHTKITMRSILLNWAVVVLLLAGVSVSKGDDQNETIPFQDVGPWVLIADPLTLERITEHIPNTINLTLTYTGSELPDYVTFETLFVVKVFTTNDLTVVLSKEQLVFTLQDVTEGNNKSLEVTGQVIGYVDLNFVLDILPKNGSLAADTVAVLSDYLVTVVRASDTLDNVFTVLVMFPLILAFLLLFSCFVDLNGLREVQCGLKQFGEE